MHDITLPVLMLAGLLIAAVSALLYRQHRRSARQLLWATLRMAVQLTLVGLVLQALFAHTALWSVCLVGLLMMLLAGHEIRARQRYRGGWRGEWLTGLLSLSLGSMLLTLLTLTVLVQPEPWYQPRYAIPFLGMLLGNSMTGIAMTLNRIREGAFQQAAIVETRLALGEDARSASAGLRADGLRQSLIGVINMLAAAGVVSLPGMMTGQLLAGADPLTAVRYQILILLLIATATVIGSLVAAELACRQLFDNRQRLALGTFTDHG
ncbi:hypothetical protein A11A3_02037 [Alcanivorax hongdengensis A-11-3]|uniref:ABC transporter permease n=1 Tax=Alcanivorax hongdengensis A-11-3 TaxID=1177179 RepID=L0WID7_9GAMM|nr:iron export ABC transporter permease subunit FetB [Alcanivorax hongdengensis]EKF75610.1 hypothetical protein A11A3_02037 [Alcanivorax hongdengensis A-11-3]